MCNNLNYFLLLDFSWTKEIEKPAKKKRKLWNVNWSNNRIKIAWNANWNSQNILQFSFSSLSINYRSVKIALWTINIFARIKYQRAIWDAFMWHSLPQLTPQRYLHHRHVHTQEFHSVNKNILLTAKILEEHLRNLIYIFTILWVYLMRFNVDLQW